MKQRRDEWGTDAWATCCGKSLKKFSTEKKPYHFVGSGLENVYLVGVAYEVNGDGMQAADIPSLPMLMEAIGKVLVEKKTPLSADEVRFLRKWLRFASRDFAKLVGMTSEQYSWIENGAAHLTATVERVIRLLYAALARLSAVEIHDVAIPRWTGGTEPAEENCGLPRCCASLGCADQGCLTRQQNLLTK